MADLFLSPLLQVIFDRLASPILQSCGKIWHMEDNLKNLEHALLMVQAVLEDAEAEEVTNKAVKIWLSKLKTAAYNAEDMLDKITARFLRNPNEVTEGFLVSALRQPSTIFNANELTQVLQELETTAMEGSNFNLKQGSPMSAGQSNNRNRETGSLACESKIYGRHEDRENIVKLLLSKEEKVSYISIVGIGGVGKTTVAQLAYNDKEVEQSFDVKVWVYVSDDFDVKRIMNSVIESATKDRCDSFTMDVLQSKLWSLLHKKRFLIVLDDVWTEDREDWDKLEPLFEAGIKGSKILITTRTDKVASIMSSPPFKYYLKGLADEDCWKLFKDRAFQQGEEDKYHSLIPIGKMIIQKCGGLPFAAKQLGSLMRFKREVKDWLFVKNSALWRLDEGQTRILPALRLSYIHLPSHLKHCFAFCSIFPKRYAINKEKLIQMWMAVGLIQSNAANKPLEDIGEEYFQHLLWASFFEDAGHFDDGGKNVYRMHDLMHELALFVRGKEFVTLEHNLASGSLKETRHAYVICDFRFPKIPESLAKAHHLQTLIGVDIVEQSWNLYHGFQFLRLLDLKARDLHKLPVFSFRNFVCLRYLDLSYSCIKIFFLVGLEELPLLQTLNLCHCYNLVELPVIAKMISLRHLDITACDALESMLPSHARVICRTSINAKSRELITHYIPRPSNQIQTLSMVVIDCFLDLLFLGQLNLHGELTIKNLQRVTNAEEANSANLAMKDKLDSLGLHWGSQPHKTLIKGATMKKRLTFRERVEIHSSGSSQHQSSQQSEGHQPDANVSEEIIKALHPHQNLKKLIVEGYPGKKFSHWTLPNLIEMNLVNCVNCECLPVLGDLLLLKSLQLRGLPAVTCIGREFYGRDPQRPFPSLEELVIEDFHNLQEWFDTDGGDAFPSLCKLIIKKCPKLNAMPNFSSLEHLEIRDCSAVLFNSVRSLSSLTMLIIEKVAELLSLPEEFLANSPLLAYLEIMSCPNLQFLPPELASLTALKSFKVRWCGKLSALPQGLQNLKALESLEIGDCHSIISMPEDGIGGLSSLRSLSVENCSNLTSLSMSLQNLTSLEDLTIMYCPNLASLPKDLYQLSALRSLTIISCPQFLSLPEELKHVTTLQSFEIGSCPGLTALPEWIGDIGSLRSLIISDCSSLKELPEGLKLLTALQHLSIQDCHELEQRCKSEDGEDWPKIAHVPHKHIGSPEVSQSGAEGSSST